MNIKANAFKYTELMVYRRKYTNVIERGKLNGVDDFVRINQPHTNKEVIIYYIKRGEKVTIQKIRSIIDMLVGNPRIIIIYDTIFTPDAKQATNVPDSYVFESFTYDEMQYDILSLIDNPYELYNGVIFKDINKIPKICDIVTKYHAFPYGSIISVKDDRTKIPVLYTVNKIIVDDIRKK